MSKRRWGLWVSLAALAMLVGGNGSALAEERSWEMPPTFEMGRELTFTPFASDRLRFEAFNWFDPGSAAAPFDNSDYNFFANVLRFGGAFESDLAGVLVEGQHTALLNLPDDAPGGPGAVYFGSNGDTDDQAMNLRQAYLSIPSLGLEGLSFKRGGRFVFNEGLEGMENAKHPNLKWLKKMRISQRLIGGFDYTHIGRSLDGGYVEYKTGPWTLSVVGGKPTAGGFHLNASGHLADVYTVYTAATLTEPEWLPRSDIRLFYAYYEDARDETIATDNRSLTARALDGRSIRIHTIGANFARIYPMGQGDMDTLVWVAGQTGEWQSLDHSAYAVAIEGGYRFNEIAWKPWARVGYFRGSGDDDPDDGDHDTFFQMLPTARLYALTPFYNLMNNQDLFAQLILKPSEKTVLRTDYHYLRVAEDADLLYFGGGAGEDDTFGYGGFPARDKSNVGHLLDLTFIWDVSRHVKLWWYYGHTFGGSVIDAQFPADDNLDYFYFESTFKW